MSEQKLSLGGKGVEAGPYYAKDGLVWKHPIVKENKGGGTTITIGFPICEPHDAVGVEAAETIAALMNLGDAAPAMQAALISARPYVESAADDALPNPASEALALLDAALALSQSKGGAND
jgi:hypothetical protein